MDEQGPKLEEAPHQSKEQPKNAEVVGKFISIQKDDKGDFFVQISLKTVYYNSMFF